LGLLSAPYSTLFIPLHGDDLLMQRQGIIFLMVANARFGGLQLT
jgi:hypothetical protein